MTKKSNKISYYCKECGYESRKWLGQCPECLKWNTFVENEFSEETFILESNEQKKYDIPLPLSKIDDIDEKRIKTGFNEIDNLLGGGVVEGSLILIGGAPGIGKSTLLLQIVRNFGNNNLKVLYVSGEENIKQIKTRAKRLGNFNDNITFVSTSNLQSIFTIISKDKPNILIIDSIQTMVYGDSENNYGSLSQIKYCTSLLLRLSKTYNISTFIVGHITKEGLVAGPKLLEHMVDVVLYFEDDYTKNLRILRCKKNRFGANDTLAIFEMNNTGLTEVLNPSSIFLEGRNNDTSGCVITCIIEANRPILLEIQALVTKSSLGIPRRTINGADINKLNLLIAIIEKRMNYPLYQYDIYINITGGIKIKDTSIDLAIIMAIISSYRNIPLEINCIYCGEVGLSGEIRSISNINQRLKEGLKLGYKKFFIPKINYDSIDENIIKENKDIFIKPVKDVIN